MSAARKIAGAVVALTAVVGIASPSSAATVPPVPAPALQYLVVYTGGSPMPLAGGAGSTTDGTNYCYAANVPPYCSLTLSVSYTSVACGELIGSVGGSYFDGTQSWGYSGSMTMVGWVGYIVATATTTVGGQQYAYTMTGPVQGLLTDNDLTCLHSAAGLDLMGSLAFA